MPTTRFYKKYILDPGRKDLLGNLRYRKELREAAAGSAKVRESLIQACAEDVLFWMNAFCIAAGTLVVTGGGLVPIESVTADDLVWDGVGWVSQEGAIFRGVKEVISAYGVRMTPDHKVMTINGWQQANQGHDRQEVKQPPEPRSLQDADIQYLAQHDGKVREPEAAQLSQIRGARYLSVRALDGIRELSGGHGRTTERTFAGQNRQQRRLLPIELPLGDGYRAGEQQAGKKRPLPNAFRNELGRNFNRGCCTDRGNWKGRNRSQVQARLDGGSDSGKNSPSVEVYDLVNCGPRRAFTVVGDDGKLLLVHNCFVHEPRPRLDANGKRLPKVIPFITWPHQDALIEAMREALGLRDIGINKSRGEGLSWIAVIMGLHEWLFDPDGVNIGLVSSKMDKADKAGNMDSLLQKAVWELDKLPAWMSGKRAPTIADPGDWTYNGSDHSLVNRRNGSQINAFAATGGAGRGGRYTWFVADELGEWDEGPATELMDSTGPATDSRLIISTPAGPAGAYYRFIHAPSNALKLTSHWVDNIAKNRGLYRLINGKPVALDPKSNPLPENYSPPSREILDMFARLKEKGFDLKMGVRSPWYDNECDRGNSTPQSIAKELDLNFGGSVAKYFQSDFFEVAEATVRNPQIKGMFFANPETVDWDFERSSEGPFHLWTELDIRNMPPRSDYAVTCDVAVGGGGVSSSNSALEVVNLVTREQVLEFASNTIKPEDFADIAIGVCHWFYGAYLAWEHQGPGTAFGTRVKNRGYSNVFQRKVPWKSSVNRTVMEIGWLTTTDSKEAMFEGLRSAVKRRELFIHSKALIDELHQYVRVNGKIEHVGQKSAGHNETGAAHGDRVIAIAIAVQAAKDRPHAIRRQEDWLPSNAPPLGTLAYREWFTENQNKVSDDWDTRSTWDLTQRHGTTR